MPEGTGFPGQIQARNPSSKAPVDLYGDLTSGSLYAGLWVWNTDSGVWEKSTKDRNIHGYNGTNWQPVKIDESTRTINTISHVHHKAHGGKLFHAYRGDTLATNDTIIIAITTPAGAEEQHVFWELYSSGAITFDVVRDLTSYTGGTSLTPKNNNMRSGNTSNCVVEVGSNGILSDGITPSGGTEHDKHSFGSGNKSGGSAAHDEEDILEEEEIVMYRIAAVGNNIVCDLHLSWYEHTPQAA